jgi:hypothetical protein
VDRNARCNRWDLCCEGQTAERSWTERSVPRFYASPRVNYCDRLIDIPL